MGTPEPILIKQWVICTDGYVVFRAKISFLKTAEIAMHAKGFIQNMAMSAIMFRT